MYVIFGPLPCLPAQWHIFSPFPGSPYSSSVKWRSERGKGKVKRVKGREERICLLLQGGKGCESVSGHFTGDKLGEREKVWGKRRAGRKTGHLGPTGAPQK